MEVLLIIILGSLVGLSSALLGLGGNILIVPILPLASGLPLQSVIATGIFTVLFVTFNNVINFYRQGLLDFKLITLLFLPTLIGSYTSSYFAHIVPEYIIKILFIAVMAAMTLKLYTHTSISSLKKTKTRYTYCRLSQ